METTEHRCALAGKEFGGYVPNNRFRIESWDVCFGGRVTGLMDYFKDGMPVKDGKLVCHIMYCPYCGEEV